MKIQLQQTQKSTKVDGMWDQMMLKIKESSQQVI